MSPIKHKPERHFPKPEMPKVFSSTKNIYDIMNIITSKINEAEEWLKSNNKGAYNDIMVGLKWDLQELISQKPQYSSVRLIKTKYSKAPDASTLTPTPITAPKLLSSQQAAQQPKRPISVLAAKPWGAASGLIKINKKNPTQEIDIANMHFGSYSLEVIKIQSLLNQAIDRIDGAKIKVNGFYGTATVAAVAVIQKLKSLKVSGLIGPKTLIAIKEVSTQQRPDSF